MSKNPAEKTDLGRKLGLGAVLALGVGTTVGSGIFSSLSEVAGAAGSSLFLVLAFVINLSASAVTKYYQKKNAV